MKCQNYLGSQPLWACELDIYDSRYVQVRTLVNTVMNTRFL